MTKRSEKIGHNREQVTPLPPCPLRARWLAPSGQRRKIGRRRAHVRTAGKDTRHRRKALAEPPFGARKRRAEYRHFLVRGFAKVRGEWSPMALCDNFSRVLHILGFRPLVRDVGAECPQSGRQTVVVRVSLPRRLSQLAAAICRAYHAIPVAQLRCASASQRTSCTFLPSLCAQPVAINAPDGFRRAQPILQFYVQITGDSDQAPELPPVRWNRTGTRNFAQRALET
jgi:Transposase DDE domain